MQASLITSSPSSSSAVNFLLDKGPNPITRLPFCLFSCRKKLSGSGQRSLVVARANKRKEKPDSHSFIPKPDEATGPFPEAVLLKKKVVKEDGSVVPEFADAEEEKLYEFLKLQLESDLKLERIRHYEVVYLIHEDHIEEVDNVVSKVQDFIKEKKGRLWRLNNWGLRRLSYKIKKASKANYILMNFEMEAKWINDFKSMLDKDERVIRHLVMKRDEAITEDCPPPPEFHTVKAGDDVDEDDEEEEEDSDENGGDGDDGDGDDDDEEEDDGGDDDDDGGEEDDEEETGTDYLVRPIARPEDEEDASDFEPGEENGEDDDIDEEDDDGETGKEGPSAKRKRSQKDDDDDDDDDDDSNDDDDDERPSKR
ncbi:acidic leucine-rich nuclear phosphoprotein 32 family member B [Dendrobium catenatum]|uniref:acidic leucine-rich nuclear phosphoprotein 32 family member B n=1 Tax=Dendrobium catenatum TaxID=906689 RepID=UPI0009F4EE3D|nr:acidic leucine-rich nuclear phosphoprotein 32 family member B [Dendrobium catenatum]